MEDRTGFAEIQREEEQETAERRERSTRKRLGVKSTKESITNFPRKGDNQEVSLSNSRFPVFPLEKAKSIKISKSTIWRLYGGKDHLDMLERTIDGDDSSEVLSWIRSREKWAESNYKKVHLRPIMSMVKHGVVASLGIGHMMNVINTGVTGKDSSFKLQSRKES